MLLWNVERFDLRELKKLYKPVKDSHGEANGQVTIIGGSHLFHGAALLSLKATSRVVDMVFFTSPEPRMGEIANALKSQLSSFIWVPMEEIEHYIAKSDAVLIGPGFMRFASEKSNERARSKRCDHACQVSRELTQRLLLSYPDKKWVIDAGALQTMEPSWIPKNAVLTPNKKEFAYLFGDSDPHEVAKNYSCIVVLKGPVTVVYSPDKCVEVAGGNAGMTKGGTGDIQAGLTVGLLAKNEPFLAATAASSLIKQAADELYAKAGYMYNADDLASQIPIVFSARSAVK